MKESKILSKAAKYCDVLSLIFLLLTCLLELIIENKICLGIFWSCFVFSTLAGFIIEIVINYSKQDVPKKYTNIFYYSNFFEICCWLFIAARFLYTIFINGSFVVKLVYDIIIVLSSFISLFLSDIVEDKHHRGYKILICIAYTFSIILFCIQNF